MGGLVRVWVGLGLMLVWGNFVLFVFFLGRVWVFVCNGFGGSRGGGGGEVII